MKILPLAFLSLTLACAGSPASAQADPQPEPPPTRVLERVQDNLEPPSGRFSSESVEESENLLDLASDDSVEDTLSPPIAPLPRTCLPQAPRAATVGVWPQAAKALGACSARQAMAAFVSNALPVLSRELWCYDPGGVKAAERKAGLLLLARPVKSPAQRRASSPGGGERVEPARGVGSFFNWSFPVERSSEELRSGGAEAGPIPASSTSSALSWDAREAVICASWGEGPAELSPAVSVYAIGNATLGGQRCPAILAEINVLSGRFSGARAHALIGLERCAGLSNPMSVSLSAALSSSGASSAWLRDLLGPSRWDGPAPRPARSAVSIGSR